jgi:hypothetical protein
MATDEELLKKPITFISKNTHTTTNCGYTVLGVMDRNFELLGTQIKTYLEDINAGNVPQLECYYNIVAINSNFSNYSLTGYEHLIKTTKVLVQKSSRARQGNGTSFNSCVELNVKFMKYNVKPYKLKCFPQTGYIQITGVKHEDMQDAKDVITAVVHELTYIGLLYAPVIFKPDEYSTRDTDEYSTRDTDEYSARGTDEYSEEETEIIEEKTEIIEEKPEIIEKTIKLPEIDMDSILKSVTVDLINYKCFIITNSPRVILNAHKILYFISIGEIFIPFAKIKIPSLSECDNKLIFKVQFDNATKGKKTDITIMIYYSGKINIRGSKSIEHAKIVYEFLYKLFDTYWYDIVVLKMRTDAEMQELHKRLEHDKQEKEELIRKTLAILKNI